MKASILCILHRYVLLMFWKRIMGRFMASRYIFMLKVHVRHLEVDSVCILYVSYWDPGLMWESRSSWQTFFTAENTCFLKSNPTFACHSYFYINFIIASKFFKPSVEECKFIFLYTAADPCNNSKYIVLNNLWEQMLGPLWETASHWLGNIISENQWNFNSVQHDKKVYDRILRQVKIKIILCVCTVSLEVSSIVSMKN